MKTRLTFPLAAVLLIASVPLFGTVFRPTSDRQLVERADSVVVGTVLDSLPHLRSDGYVETRTRLLVEQTLKGDARGIVTIAELGGVADNGRFTFIADSATYAAGDHVMVFLRGRADGTWLTASMTLGKYLLRDGVALRESEELGNSAHSADVFVRFVKDAAGGMSTRENAGLVTIPAKGSANPHVTADALRISPQGTASNYALQATDVFNTTHPVRWPGCAGDPCTGTSTVSVTFKHTAPDPGGIASGLAAWTNDPASFITLSDGGVAASSGPAADAQNFIYLNYTGAFSGPGYQCDGAQACTIGSGNGTNTYDGDTWFSIADSDIIVAAGIPAGQFPTLITHELGHAIGFRHSNAGAPSSFSAIMTSPFNPSFGSVLQQWDKDAVDSIYGSGPVCVQPSITSTNGGGTVPAGSMANLSVSATGSATLSYQWYSGSATSTANPVGSNSPTYQTPPINSTSNFWVRVSNGCGTADSATITVTPATCVPPTVNTQPANQTISSGGTAGLSVGNNGTFPFTYQWYQGSAGDTNNPISGANQLTFTTPVLTQTTSYWVQVANSCGTVNSATATITVQGGTCTNPAFTIQPQSLTLTPTTVTFLFAAATNVSSYNWFKGAVGDTSSPVTSSPPSNARYVQQLYVDILSRAPDAGALAIINALNASSLTRAGAATAVITSTEGRTRLITTMYGTFLHRAPLPSELSFWIPTAFSAGLTDEQIAAQFLGSPEYFALAGSNNNTWINHVYGDLLGRAPSPAEASAGVALLGAGSRSAVSLTIANSAEARGNRVKGWYSSFLRRPADAPGLTAFTTALVGGATDEAVLALFLASDEYFNFGSLAVIGPLASTTKFWVQAFNSCGTGNSIAAVITIPQCTNPVIVTQPQNATINIGAIAPLAVYSAGATSYQWYQAQSGDPSNPVAGATGPLLNLPINATGIVQYWVNVTNACGSTASATATLTINCVAPIPQIRVQPTAPSTSSYVVAWSANNAVAFRYDLQESATADFANPTETQTTAQTVTIPAKGTAITTDTRLYYRVRMDPVCGGLGDFSAVGSVLVTAPPPPNTPTTSLNPTGTPCTGQNCNLTAPLFIPGFNASGKTSNAVDDTYTVTSDKAFLAVTPASGALPSGGLNLTATVDTSSLDVGSTQATLTISRTQNASGKIGPTAVSSSTVPVSVNLVTPISPTPKDNNPPANTLLIPAVAHAAGIGSHFQSDIRITNTAAQSITYQLIYTPTAIDGTTQGKTATITIAPGDTKALNDLVATWYGAGSVGEGGLGTLEIRPQNYSGKIGDVSVNFATVASSRTYNVTSTGTFGQFIPAMTLTSFLGKSASSLSLQQVAQSPSSCTNNCFRTNFGFVEGAGQNADMVLTLFSADGTQAAQRTFSLLPFEHVQQNLSALFPGTTLSDGRLQVQVTSDGGKVTAYASVLDNVTSDPLAVFPVDTSKVSTNHIVVPGIAELNNGAANFHSDMRLFNAGTTDTTVTLNYTTVTVPAKQIVVPAGQIVSVNNTLNSLWGLTGSGGAVIATTDAATPLIITARTFSRRADGGTFGQFIPGVTATDATGLGERPLQVVQLEQSAAFRSNLGLVEVTGNAVDLDIAAFTPDSKVAAHYQTHLEANQFNQLGSFFATLGLGNTYNGRVAVSVIGGTGRVAAYGSVIDSQTQDPTYVPAQ